MPLYEYVCQDCGREVEVLVRTSTEVPECPECGSQKLTKLLSVPSAPSSGEESGGGCCNGSGCSC